MTRPIFVEIGCEHSTANSIGKSRDGCVPICFLLPLVGNGRLEPTCASYLGTRGLVTIYQQTLLRDVPLLRTLFKKKLKAWGATGLEG